MAFPTTSVLDNFNRANEGPPPSVSWSSSAIASASSGLSVSSNEMKDSGEGGAWGTDVGPNSEVFLTAGSTLILNVNAFTLWLRGKQIGAVTVDGYTIQFTRKDSNPGVQIQFYRVDNNSFTLLGATFQDTSGAIAVGTKFGVEIIENTLSAYINKSGSWVSQTSRTESTYGNSGSIMFRSDVVASTWDDFGGGTVVVPPGETGTFRTDRIRSRRTSW